MKRAWEYWTIAGAPAVETDYCAERLHAILRRWVDRARAFFDVGDLPPIVTKVLRFACHSRQQHAVIRQDLRCANRSE